MTGWDHEFAVAFINEGHFCVTDPGPLRAPVIDFSLRRDKALDLILETRTAPDAKSTVPEHPNGTVRITTECASLENIGGVKVKLTGVLPYQVRTSTNYRTGQDEHVEEAKIHALEAMVRSGTDARYTIDWLENLPMSPFVWPDSVETKIETATTRKFGLGNDGIRLFSTDSGHSSSHTAAKIVVSGTEVYVCHEQKDDLTAKLTAQPEPSWRCHGVVSCPAPQRLIRFAINSSEAANFMPTSQPKRRNSHQNPSSRQSREIHQISVWPVAPLFS